MRRLSRLYDVFTECVERFETDKRLLPAERTFAAAVIMRGFWAQRGNDIWERAFADAKAMGEQRWAKCEKAGRRTAKSRARTNQRPTGKAKKAVRRAAH